VPDSFQTLGRRAMLLAMVLSTVTPAPGWTWGSAGHHYIAQNYSKHLPTAIDGLKAYDATVDSHVMDPDARKSYTPGEDVKHFIDADSYDDMTAIDPSHPWANNTLSHDRPTLEALYGAGTVSNIGVVPWAVADVVTTLTSQFQAQNWSAAALTIADLCHYCGDSSQPLHCCKNYDGQLTGQNGVHSRYETQMFSSTNGGSGRLPSIVITPTQVQYFGTYSTIVDKMFENVRTSFNDVTPLLQADLNAKSAAGGVTSGTTYYSFLWSNTQNFTTERITTASWLTASMVYTAWVNAGMPAVPGSSAASVPEVANAARLEAGPTPFRDAITVRFAGRGALNVDVFDVRGARVASIAHGVSGAGSLSWRPAAGTAPGLYFVRMSGPEQQNLVRRVTLLD